MVKNRKIVVTGGAGFVGSHLVNHLIAREADVVILDDLSHGRNVHPAATFYRADVSDVDTCKFFFKDAFAVFNLAAAVAGVDWNKNNNASMFRNNVNVLVPPVVAASEVGVPHFVQMSSVCIYAPDNQNAPDESTGYLGFTHGANWGYGQSKRDGELAAIEWTDLDHVIVARPTNMYGTHDHFKPIEQAHVIPALIQRIDSSDGDLEVYGNPDAVREFMYVEDCAVALIHLLGQEDGIYNIGTAGETALTIKNLVDKLAGIMKKDVTPWWNSKRGGGDDIRISNPSKIHATGWSHKIDIDTGLKATVEWYRKHIK